MSDKFSRLFLVPDWFVNPINPITRFTNYLCFRETFASRDGREKDQGNRLLR